MPTDIVMPQMGESIFEGTITKWLKKPGDTVERDEPLFEISTDKVDAEIPSPAAGVLREIKVADGATVQINTVVAVIDEAASNGASPSAPPAETPQAAPAPEAADAEATVPAAAAPADSAPAASGPVTEIVMPQMGESIFEGTITKWLKQVGDKVERDEPLFEISTDKVDAEIPSPAAGVLTEIKAEAGTTVQINSVVAVIGGTAGAPAPASAPAAAPPPAAAKAAEPTPSPVSEPVAEPVAASGEHARSSPLVRKIAKENNLDLAQVPGTGAGGRITKEDVLAYLEKPAAIAAPAPVSAPPVSAPPVSAPPAAAPAAARPAAPAAPAPQPGELVPLSKMRGIIAQR